MKIKNTELEGVYLVEPETFEDERGFFREILRKDLIEEKIGNNLNILQMNSVKSKKNVLRGIHIAPWHKIIGCSYGSIQSVVIDFKKDSPTFGKYISTVISEENGMQIFVPAYCGNSYLALSEEARCEYMTNEYWTPKKEVGIIWNDSSLKIPWSISEKPILSKKDEENPRLYEVINQIINSQK